MGTAKSGNVSLSAATLNWDWPRTLAIVLCVAGLVVAGYMSWAELTGNETACADTGNIDCAAVQNSAYGTTLGIPVAVMGFLGYVAMMASVVLEDQVKFFANYGRTLLVGMALFGFVFQTYLFVIEITVLDAICQWCVISHVIVGALLVLGIFRLNQFFKPLRN